MLWSWMALALAGADVAFEPTDVSGGWRNPTAALVAPDGQRFAVTFSDGRFLEEASTVAFVGDGPTRATRVLHHNRHARMLFSNDGQVLHILERREHGLALPRQSLFHRPTAIHVDTGWALFVDAVPTVRVPGGNELRLDDVAMRNVASAPDRRVALVPGYEQVGIWDVSEPGDAGARPLGWLGVTEDGDWLVVDNEGRYASSEDGRSSAFEVTLDGQGFPLETLRPHYHHPNLLQRMLTGMGERRPVEPLRHLRPPPAVTLGPIEPDGTILLHAEDQGGGVGAVSVEVDEVDVSARTTVACADLDDAGVCRLDLAAAGWLDGRKHRAMVTVANGSGFMVAPWRTAAVLPPAQEGPLRVTPQLAYTDWWVAGAISPDGDHLLLANESGAAVLLDVETGRQLCRLDLHRRAINHVGWNPRGTRVLTSAWGEVGLWDMRTCALVRQRPGTKASWTPTGDQIVIRNEQRSNELWDEELAEQLPSERIMPTEAGHWSADRSRFLFTTKTRAGQSPRFLNLMDAQTNELVRDYQIGDIRSFALHPTDDTIWVNNSVGVGVLDLRTGEILRVYRGYYTDLQVAPNGGTVSIQRERELAVIVGDDPSPTWRAELAGTFDTAQWSPDGTQLLAATAQADITVFEARTGEVKSVLTIPTADRGRSQRARWHPDGQRVLVFGDGAHLFDATTGERIREFGGTLRPVKSVSWSPDGQNLVTVDGVGQAYVWDLVGGRPRAVPVKGVAYADWATEEEVWLWTADGLSRHDRQTGRRVSPPLPAPKGGSWGPLGPDGRHVLGYGEESVVAQLDDPIKMIHLETPMLFGAWSPLGDQLAFVRADDLKTPRRWDVHETGSDALRWTSVLPNGDSDDLQGFHLVRGAAWSHDGQRVAFGTGMTTGESAPMAVEVYGREEVDPFLRLYLGDHNGVHGVAWSPDDRRLATAGGDGVVWLWDSNTGFPLWKVDVSELAVLTVQFSPNGQRLATGAQDRTAAIFDVATGKLRARLVGHDGPVWFAEWSPDGRHLATAGADGTVRLWTSEGAPVASLVSLPRRRWAVVDVDGLYDTDDAGQLKELHLTRPFDPLRALLPTTFPAHFTPGLLSRRWRRLAVPQPKDVLDTNIVAPELKVRARAQSEDVRVDVKVCGRSEIRPMRDGPREMASGGRDIRITVGDRVVAWKDGPVAHPEGRCRTHRFRVDIPVGQPTVRVGAYVFNDDGVASDPVSVLVDNPRAHHSPEPHVFHVHVGVDTYDDPTLAPLSWAGRDAHGLNEALTTWPGVSPDHVHGVVLAAQGDAAPTRSNVERVLATLAGSRRSPRWGAGLTTAGPDDTVVLTFSGHGEAERGEAFRLRLTDGELSEFELADDLRRIAARDITLIVDACNAAATVEGEGFKPGPLASRGFGQLAYDKGLAVLAASQSQEVALELGALGHGALTAVLLQSLASPDAVASADSDGLAGLTMEEWLRYAETGVPNVLATAVADAGPARGLVRHTRGLVAVQVPRLFIYKGAGQTLVRTDQ